MTPLSCSTFPVGVSPGFLSRAARGTEISVKEILRCLSPAVGQGQALQAEIWVKDGLREGWGAILDENSRHTPPQAEDECALFPHLNLCGRHKIFGVGIQTGIRFWVFWAPRAGVPCTATWICLSTVSWIHFYNFITECQSCSETTPLRFPLFRHLVSQGILQLISG